MNGYPNIDEIKSKDYLVTFYWLRLVQVSLGRLGQVRSGQLRVGQGRYCYISGAFGLGGASIQVWRLWLGVGASVLDFWWGRLRYPFMSGARGPLPPSRRHCNSQRNHIYNFDENSVRKGLMACFLSGYKHIRMGRKGGGRNLVHSFT